MACRWNGMVHMGVQQNKHTVRAVSVIHTPANRVREQALLRHGRLKRVYRATSHKDEPWRPVLFTLIWKPNQELRDRGFCSLSLNTLIYAEGVDEMYHKLVKEFLRLGPTPSDSESDKSTPVLQEVG